MRNRLPITGRRSRGLADPRALPNLAAWYDASGEASTTSDNIRIDSSNRVVLIADKSGQSSENCLVLPGVTSNYASAAKVIPTGAWRVEAKVSFDDWTPSAQVPIVCVYNTTGDQRSWRFGVTTTGEIQLYLSSDGTLANTQNILSTVATGITDKTIGFVAADVDLTAGTVDFETSTDGLTWSPLGLQVSFTPIALFASSTNLTVGANGDGSAALSGKVYYARVYQTGSLVRNFDATAQAKLATSWTAATTGETWTINSTAIALPARIHGARDLYMGTAASQPVYLRHDGTNYGYTNAVAANYFSTPDQAITTADIDIKIRCSVNDAGITTPLICQDDITGNNRDWIFLFGGAASLLNLAWWDSGGVLRQVPSTTTISVTANTIYWFRVTMLASNGSGGHDIKFYFNADTGSDTEPTSWNQVGATTNYGAATTSIRHLAAPIMIGRHYNVYSNYKVYYAQVSGTVGGAAAVSFSVADYPHTGGSTFVSSATGETWTINGGAKIVNRTGFYHDGTAQYIKSPAFPLSQPENVYFVGRQVTHTANDSVFDGATSGGRMKINQAAPSPNITLFAGSSSTANTGYALKTDAVVSAVFNGASSSLRINRATATGGDVGAQNAGGFVLGSQYDGAGQWGNIFVHEILIYDTTAHSTATQDRLALYAGRKWRIAV